MDALLFCLSKSMCREFMAWQRILRNCKRETWSWSPVWQGFVGVVLIPLHWLLCWDWNCSLQNSALERTSCLYFDIHKRGVGVGGWQKVARGLKKSFRKLASLNFSYENRVSCYFSLWTTFSPTLVLQSPFIQLVMNDFHLLCKLLLSRLHCNEGSLAVSTINPGFQVFIITWQFSNLG